MAQHRRRAVGDGQRVLAGGQFAAADVQQRDPAVGGPEVHARHRQLAGAQLEPARGPATGGVAVGVLVDESVRDQRVDALGDRRPGEAGEPRDVGTGGGGPGADQSQHFAR
jgi:hypothetical protein